MRGCATTICLTNLLHIELIRLLIVACEMLVHSSSVAVQSYWILAGSRAFCCACRSGGFQPRLPGEWSAICLVRCKPRCIHEENTPPRKARHLCRWAHSCPSCDRKHCTWSLWRFMFYAEILRLCKPIIAATVRTAGLQPSFRWSSLMCWPWAAMSTWRLKTWGWLDVQPKSFKQHWKWLLVVEWTFILWAALMCGIVLCDQTAHFRAPFNCLDNASAIIMMFNHAVRWMDRFGKE